MARHDQQGRDTTYRCPACADEKCGLCIDVLRSNYTATRICKCGRTGHHDALERATVRERAARRADRDAGHITCPVCSKTSYHTLDVATGYCGFCHDFTGRPAHELA